jgi:RNA polymerase primary sigma factor
MNGQSPPPAGDAQNTVDAAHEKLWSSDPVQTYLRQIHRFQRMSEDEERLLVRQLRNAEEALEQALSGIGIAVDHYLSIAESIDAGHERLDRWVMERHLKDRSVFPALLQSRCTEARKLSTACTSEYRQWLRGDPDAHARFQASQLRLRELLQDFCFKQRAHSELVPKLVSLLGESAALELRQASNPGSPELESFGCLVWMTPEQFRFNVNEARHAESLIQAAKQMLVESHLWLAVIIARHYNVQSMSFLDLVQEGNLGLLRAAEMYEDNGSSRFSSYASWWIRQAITRAIADRSRLIRLPVHMSATVSAMLRVQRQFTSNLGSEPAVEDIAAELQMPAGRVQSILTSLQPPLSLQSKVGEGRDAPELGEIIRDTSAVSPDEGSALNQLGDKLNEVLAPLNDQERWVMSERYGLNDNVARTLEEVGKRANLCQQRIQQIEARAIKKLRHPKRLRLLRALTGRPEN